MAVARRIIVFALLLAVSAPLSAQHGDVSSRIERIGNPYKGWYPDYNPEMIYARNIWDMKAFDGRLYLGAGNSANSGPAVNAGPLPIVSYDPGSETFREEFVVDDEQIDRFQVLDGRLHVPGHDPTQSWNWGNFYRLESGQWKKYRNIPGGIHNYGMALHGGKLFAALGVRQGAAVSVSDDDGQSWTNHPAPGGRVYALLQSGGSLFASGMFARWDQEQLSRLPEENRQAFLERYGVAVAEWHSGRFEPRPDLGADQMFPGVFDSEGSSGRFFGKIVKPTGFGDAAVYIGGRIHNDHQFLPLGVFAAHSLEPDAIRVRRLIPDDEAGDAWDLFARDRALYVLTARKLPCDHYRVQVFRTSDLEHWTPVLHFESPTFARSFEVLDDAFYFGMGVEIRNSRNYSLCELHQDTGGILRFDPDRSDESLLLGDLGLTDEFNGHMLSLMSHRDDALRQAASQTLKVFWRRHHPLRPKDRQEFLADMDALFQDRQAQTPQQRRMAFRILLLHAGVRGAAASESLLRQGMEDPDPEIRALATLIRAVGLGSEPARVLVRRLDGESETALQHTAFSASVNRPTVAFPEGRDAEAFEQTAAIPLPHEGWRFRRDPNVGLGYLQEWFAPETNARDWAEARIGDFWASFLEEMYVGVGWYRLAFEVPEIPEFDALGLHFGGVDENAWVWINGRYAGQHNIGMFGWDKPFQINATGLIRPGRTNRITVRVKNTVANGGIWQPVELRVFQEREQAGE